MRSNAPIISYHISFQSELPVIPDVLTHLPALMTRKHRDHVLFNILNTEQSLTLKTNATLRIEIWDALRASKAS